MLATLGVASTTSGILLLHGNPTRMAERNATDRENQLIHVKCELSDSIHPQNAWPRVTALRGL